MWPFSLLKRKKPEQQSRFGAAFQGGGYLPPMGYGQLGNWNPGNGSADSDILRDLPRLRAYSRDLARTSSIAAGAIETRLAHVVGTGLTMQSRINATVLGLTDEQASEWQSNTERWFELWASSEFSTVEGTHNWYEQQGLVERSAFESGDCGIVLATKERPGWPFRLALQAVEADRISNPDWKLDTDELVAGIEIKDSEPVAAWIADRHPGERKTTLKKITPTWQRVPFRDEQTGRRLFLMHMRRLRPGQTRGVPELAPVIEVLKQVTRYSDAEIDAAVNSAINVYFAKMDPDAFREVFEEEAQQAIIGSALKWDGKVTPGRSIRLLPGEDITPAQMTRPNPNFGAFMEHCLTYIGMALGIPYEVLARKFNSSFSAARAALLDAWRGFRIRRDLLVSRVCQPVYEAWLADAVALGLISAPGFFTDPLIRAAWCSAKWAGDGPGAIDPEKEARGAEARMRIGLTTLAEEIVGYDGGDWETKHREQVRIAKARREAGLDAAADPAAAPAGPQQPGQQQPGQQQQDPPDDGQQDDDEGKQ